MKLHLGVIDVAYAGEGGVTLGRVATYLEDKYNVMANFAALHEQNIAQALEISVSESIEAVMMGAPVSIDPFAQAMQDVEQLFKTYLNDEEIAETGQEGVPTQAALNGVRTSLKKKKEIKNIKKYRSRVRGTRRPSFIDTGLYRNSFKAWIE